MKYFTPERYLALQDFSSDESMDAADAGWEKVVDQYDSYLQTVLPILPPSVGRLADAYLHDADVLSMGREGDNFVIVLQLDPPPHDLLTLRFSLAAEPVIDRHTFPAKHCSPRPRWLHEELEVIESANERRFVISILFSNGWEARIPFRDVQMTFAKPVFPVCGDPGASAAQSA